MFKDVKQLSLTVPALIIVVMRNVCLPVFLLFLNITFSLALFNLVRFDAASWQISNLLFLKPEWWYDGVI